MSAEIKNYTNISHLAFQQDLHSVNFLKTKIVGSTKKTYPQRMLWSYLNEIQHAGLEWESGNLSPVLVLSQGSFGSVFPLVLQHAPYYDDVEQQETSCCRLR